jgi:hypothetical protein
MDPQAYYEKPFPKAVQSDGWKTFVAVALWAMAAVEGGYNTRLDSLVSKMNALSPNDRTVARASATRGAYALSQANMLVDLPKGRYMLNDSGLRYAEGLLGAGAVPVVVVAAVPVPVETVPVETVPVETVPVEIAAKAMVGGTGVVWLPPSLDDGDGDDLFAEDAYLRELAAASVPCFGSYSSRAETCGGCPLRGACAESLVNRLAAVAKTLDSKAKVAESAKVSEILNPAPAPVAAPPVAAPAPSSAPAPTSGLHFREINAAFQGICSGCKGLIPPGSKARHVAGTGMFHPQCLI